MMNIQFIKSGKITGTTSVCDIYTKSGLVYRGVNIIQLTDSILTFMKGKLSKEVNINLIKKIVFWKTAWVNGVFDGFIAGLVSGFIFGYAISKGGGGENWSRGAVGL